MGFLQAMLYYYKAPVVKFYFHTVRNPMIEGFNSTVHSASSVLLISLTAGALICLQLSYLVFLSVHMTGSAARLPLVAVFFFPMLCPCLPLQFSYVVFLACCARTYAYSCHMFRPYVLTAFLRDLPGPVQLHGADRAEAMEL